MKELAKKLEELAVNSRFWVEFRYHRRQSHSLQVQTGLVKQAKASSMSGLGVRVLLDGGWGFSSTSDLSQNSIERALKSAAAGAKALNKLIKHPAGALPKATLARGEFSVEGYAQLHKMSLEEKLEQVLAAEAMTRHHSRKVQSAVCMYNEIFEDKIVVTSDGANASSQLARNEFRISAVASQGSETAEGISTSGKTGNWECLFQKNSIEALTQNTAELAIDLTSAPRIPGGLSTLILSPAMVGLLAHEAIGHTVEADFVLSGSVAAGKLGQLVASPLVTLVDSGVVSLDAHAGGLLLVDDEGITTSNTVIIKDGILNSYLHNRESAALFRVLPTGNARAWMYRDEPLIRMRNTYLLPGNKSLEEIISSTEDGYLVDGPLGGQADATGEFMFGAQKVIKIENGKTTKLFRGATISGQAFEVLKTVDAVSKEFHLDLGSGYCGKGQPAKVDAGGPYIRCKAIIGGVQS